MSNLVEAIDVKKNSHTFKLVAGFVTLFLALVGITMYLSATGKVTFNVALLMLVALLGLYVGFGVLIAVYRLVSKL